VGSRTFVATLLSVSVSLASVGTARAAEPAPIVWPTTVTGEGAFRPRLDVNAPLSLLAPRELRQLRLPDPSPLKEIRLTKDEKIIIIVAACVVGAIVLFATLSIGHHPPFD
jgi:hypothetical protein